MAASAASRPCSAAQASGEADAAPPLPPLPPAPGSDVVALLGVLSAAARQLPSSQRWYSHALWSPGSVQKACSSSNGLINIRESS